MRTAASEHLNQAQVMSRLGATFSALIREQVDIVRRLLEDEQAGETSGLRSIAELSVRLVERSAEWLHMGEVASLALEVREAMAQLGQLRPAQRQDLITQCRVALDMEEKLADRLRSEGFASLVEHAEQVMEAIDRLRANLIQARSEAREMIDSTTPDVGEHENLLALTFEIKNALVHQNERICVMNELVDAAIRSSQTALGDWEGVAKTIERQRLGGGPAGASEMIPEGKPLAIHQRMQDVASGLHTLAHEVTQLLGLQYSLERRARDLDEHLLWEFLDPLDRYVDELYSAVSRGLSGSKRVRLSVHTGGVGFEPEVGSILLPLLTRLLESAEPLESPEGEPEIRLTAAREGLEARVEVEGPVVLEEEALRLLENALETLGGFASHRENGADGMLLKLQFPMARSLRSFLIVEAAGQRLALPWSAVERIYASREELPWGAAAPGEVHALASLFDAAAAAGGESKEAEEPAGRANGAAAGNGMPLAVLRCGSGSAVVVFDRIVWRENARLRPLPQRLYPLDEVLGGIVAPDNSITLVVNPAALLRRIAVARASLGASAT
jgi:chemotaxis protein histidine kinase CheA